VSKLTVEIDRAIASGDHKITGFTGAVRNLETILVKGDEFTIPEILEVYAQKLPGGNAEYIFVETKTGEIRKLYPSVFTKSRTVVDDNDVVTTERKATNGTAADLFKSEGSVAKAMDKLKGKTLVVTDVIPFRTPAYGRPGEVVTTNVYTIDIKA
jgi:hypothetical protein